MKKSLVVMSVWALAGLWPSLAFGHPGHADHGLGSGFAHPLGGADHVLAMVAVGIWAAQLGGRAVWLVPSTFIGAMILGAILGRAGISLPFVEGGIAASVLVIGLTIALALRVPVPVAAIGVGLFAILHGHAHGSELGDHGGWATYCVGFVLATALLHLFGIGLTGAIKRIAPMPVVQFAGGAIAVCGVFFLAGY